MKTLEITELRDNINEVLNEVEHGEMVTVARSGRVIARLIAARKPYLVKRATSIQSRNRQGYR